jgi:curved DNA-binding protein CbpA
MPADDPDFYAILGVAPDASPAQIAHAYRWLIRACHPDPDPAVLTAAAAAYAILRDPARRAAYKPPPLLIRNRRQRREQPLNGLVTGPDEKPGNPAKPTKDRPKAAWNPTAHVRKR